MDTPVSAPLRRELEALTAAIAELRGRVDAVHALASDSLQGANHVTQLTLESLREVERRLRALEAWRIRHERVAQPGPPADH